MTKYILGRAACIVTITLGLLNPGNLAQIYERQQQENKTDKEKQANQTEKEKKEKKERVSLSVEVKDRETLNGIEQAQVTIMPEGAAAIHRKTNRSGIALFSDIVKGTVTIRVIAPNYKTTTDKLELKEKQNSIEIKPDKDTK